MVLTVHRLNLDSKPESVLLEISQVCGSPCTIYFLFLQHQALVSYPNHPWKSAVFSCASGHTARDSAGTLQAADAVRVLVSNRRFTGSVPGSYISRCAIIKVQHCALHSKPFHVDNEV